MLEPCRRDATHRPAASNPARLRQRETRVAPNRRPFGKPITNRRGRCLAIHQPNHRRFASRPRPLLARRAGCMSETRRTDASNPSGRRYAKGVAFFKAQGWTRSVLPWVTLPHPIAYAEGVILAGAVRCLATIAHKGGLARGISQKFELCTSAASCEMPLASSGLRAT